MTLDVALPTRGTFAVQNRPKTEFAGGISSVRSSWVDTFPSPFDTISRPEVGISVQENTITISIDTTSEIRPAKWLNKTITDMVRLLMLPQDWNSDSPNRIEPKVIEKILSLLLVIDPDVNPPTVVPLTQGGIQVEWHQNGIDFEIEALNSGKLEFFFSGPTGEKEGTIEDDSTVLKQYWHYLINK